MIFGWIITSTAAMTMLELLSRWCPKFEFVVGTLLLLLGWLCLNQGAQGRRPDGRTPRKRPESEGPPMTVRATLGLLLILKGAALLTLGIFSRCHAAGGSASF